MTYKMIAQRHGETVESERNSRLIAFAKAKVWAGEGWDVVVIDNEGQTIAPQDFDKVMWPATVASRVAQKQDA
ncbi:MAG TPA: hypothetical protein VGE73_02870 [Pseudolabrys sp.]|nr:hypothetical protein [Hyphomicrobiales bacterium]